MLSRIVICAWYDFLMMMGLWPQTMQTLKKGSNARRIAFRADLFQERDFKHTYVSCMADEEEMLGKKKQPYTRLLYWAMVYTMMPEAGKWFSHHALFCTMIVGVVTDVCLGYRFSGRPE
jgi:hypothetical protein